LFSETLSISSLRDGKGLCLEVARWFKIDERMTDNPGCKSIYGDDWKSRTDFKSRWVWSLYNCRGVLWNFESRLKAIDGQQQQPIDKSIYL
jgi:hypothetical protein